MRYALVTLFAVAALAGCSNPTVQTGRQYAIAQAGTVPLYMVGDWTVTYSIDRSSRAGTYDRLASASLTFMTGAGISEEGSSYVGGTYRMQAASGNVRGRLASGSITGRNLRFSVGPVNLPGYGVTNIASNIDIDESGRQGIGMAVFNFEDGSQRYGRAEITKISPDWRPGRTN